jgi:predicted sulfurtransferase
MIIEEFITKLSVKYKFKNVVVVHDELKEDIKSEGYTTCLLGPSDYNIDVDDNRISVLLNSRNEISGFQIG